MTELLDKKLLPLTTLISGYKKEILANGSILYTAPGHQSFQLAVGPFGQRLLEENQLDGLIGLEIPLYREVKKKNLAAHLSFEVAVKSMPPSYLELTGIDQFQAMVDLTKQGVLCTLPIAATRDRFISQWVNGRTAKVNEYGLLKDYLDNLVDLRDDLVYTGIWNKHWEIDHNPNNYYINNLTSDNILHRFITFDPVMYLPH